METTSDVDAPVRIPAGEIHIEVDLDHGVLTLLVADDAVVDGWALHRLGRGRVKDATGSTAAAGRRIVLTGQVRSAEVRVKRGIAVLSAMCSRDYVADLRRAHREGGVPTVDDPTRAT